ncbi:hemagglutinin-esterase [Influenza C virus]|nr:hemagglutinin-esterase [Influenza C virus]
MFFSLLLVFGLTEAEKIKICLQKQVNSSFSLHNGFGGNLYATEEKRMFELVKPKAGASVLNQSTWIGFGDSRTDKSNSAFPRSADVSEKTADKFRSLSGGSLMLSMFGPPGKVDYLYQGCGKHKVFYEGVNWSPHAAIDCYRKNWTDIKLNFQKNIYELASQSHCLSLVNALDKTIPLRVTKGVAGNCNDSFLKNPALYTQEVKPSENKCGEENLASFTLPTRFGTYDCKIHLVASCYFIYDSKEVYNKRGCGNYFQVIYDSSGKVVGGLDNRVSPYTGNSGDTPTMQCDMLQLKPGRYSVRSSPRFLLMPERSYCFDMKEKGPVTAVQSIWGKGRKSDYAVDQACLSTPGCMLIQKQKPYVGEADAHHGDQEMRELLSGLDYEARCVSQSGWVNETSPFAKEYLLPPKFGRCPLAAKEESIPKIPDGLLIPTSGTDTTVTKPKSRIFGIDDLIIGLLFVAIVEAGIGGYLLGSRKESGGGVTKESAEKGFEKIGNDIQILRSSTNIAIEKLNDRISHDEQAIRDLTLEIENARSEALLGELGIIRALLVGNISIGLQESLWELASEITNRAGDLAVEVSPGCWIIDNNICDQSCQDFIFKFNETAPVPTIPPLDTKIDLQSDPFYWGSSLGLAITAAISLAALVISGIAICRTK